MTKGRGQDTRPTFLAGGGEMGERIRGFDWSKTPLGPVEVWPQSLRSAVSILLPSKAQIVLFWGGDLVTLYNDAYRPVFGAKHPDVLGMPARQAWSEIWRGGLEVLFEGVLATGEAYWASNRPFFIKRHGFLEETFFDVSYDPVRDESGKVGGIFCIVSETTGRVLGERRLRTLRELGARAAGVRSAKEACRVAAATMAENDPDVAFALLYLLEEGGRRATLAGSSGLGPGAPASPASIDLQDRAAPWPLHRVTETGGPIEISDLPAALGPLPGGAWPEAAQRAVILPMKKSGQKDLAGFVVAGASPRLPLTDEYRGFLDLMAGHVAAAVANARAYEEEKRRTEALAELDRAKTAFFSNVSHEFRTPLTLMLGPVEDLLARSHTDLSPAAARQLEVVNRNGLRLLRLVNTLLDFSRIEAGRVRATYQPTDLAAFTGELASVFRAAVERAGLKLTVDCPKMDEPVFVDRDMWEKIVLNLLSNAFKFTFDGEIAVTLRRAGTHAELQVRDTGTGVAAAEIPRLFERFHRVENARGRTHDGSGIGLALVQELVRLHGGSITAESAPGRGTTFTVRVPLGSAHLPADQIGSSRALESRSTGAGPFVEEALRWLPQHGQDDVGSELPSRYEALPVPALPADLGSRDSRPLVLVADDNADMRQYIARLLAERYRAEAVADGEAALAAARRTPPDLVLTDVMMPRLDGFGVLQGLREDPRTREVPVIMLSARAGEESRVEGMEAGADDYLIKPFSARELLARVGAHLQMARMRREASEALREADRRKDEFLAMLSHELRGPLAPLGNMLEVVKRAGDNAELLPQAYDTMERQLSQLVRLVDDLLDVSRITRNKMELRKQRVELASIVHHAAEACRPLGDSLGHEVAVTLPPEPVYLNADAARLAQVFQNLLNNACKYTEPGGRVWLTAERQAGDVVVTVKDTGVGIPPDKLASIFDMFTQVDASRERARGGLGIGLALVKRLVEMHDGTVEARSEGPGRGSEFVVRLPVLTETLPAAQQATAAAKERAAVARRILVVDDNADSAESLTMLLQVSGHETHMAHDGREALAAAERFRPEVVLMDIGLPRLNGYDAARHIREQPWGKDMVLVALTGWGQEEDRRKSKEAGFDLHMVKPVDLDLLMERLASLPSGSQR
jgi:signal transduction histidine kinase